MQNRKLKNRELNRKSVDEFKSAKKVPLVIVLDSIRSFNNIGSVFRTADAFLLEAIFLCGITASPPHKDIHKTALGATESVKWEYFDNIIDAVKQLKDNGFTVVSIEQTEKSILLGDYEISNHGKYALVFGNEIKGVLDEVVNVSDVCIEIPQFGTKHSINISVCVGIVVWEFFQKLSGIK